MKRVSDVALPKLAALVQRAGCLPALWAHARLACTFPERKEALSPLGLLFYVKLQLVELSSRPTDFRIFSVTRFLMKKKKEKFHVVFICSAALE